MMAFITHCSKKLARSSLACLLAAALLCLTGGWARAASGQSAEPDGAQVPVLTLDRADGALWLSARFNFDLPAVVEDALLKGIPIYFVAEADLLRERWYWTNRKITSVQRRMRLSYHPLTRRWRLGVGTLDPSETAQGIALNQNFDTLSDVMAAVRRVSRWKIADLADVDSSGKYVVEFRFSLDTSQLPRPLQICTLGQSDWVIDVKASQVFDPEHAK
ncbi:hypothetical protein GALL_499080 [mine drainage metagenome]|uniref:Proline rich signal peptide protein n=1 Tax=mine drainage metagenome TaxID=410659 RepID=A0A1J5PBC0_9ZZZZ